MICVGMLAEPTRYGTEVIISCIVMSFVAMSTIFKFHTNSMFPDITISIIHTKLTLYRIILIKTDFKLYQKLLQDNNNYKNE